MAGWRPITLTDDDGREIRHTPGWLVPPGKQRRQYFRGIRDGFASRPCRSEKASYNVGYIEGTEIRMAK